MFLFNFYIKYTCLPNFERKLKQTHDVDKK